MMEYAAYGNVFIREGRLDKDSFVAGHAHAFDHVTYIPCGAVLFERLKDGVVEASVEKRAGEKNWILIKAGTEHRLTGLEDGTVYHCIYAHRNPQGEVVQDYDGWTPGYE